MMFSEVLNLTFVAYSVGFSASETFWYKRRFKIFFVRIYSSEAFEVPLFSFWEGGIGGSFNVVCLTGGTNWGKKRGGSGI